MASVGGRIADRHTGVLAALEDDHDSEVGAEALVERLHPVLAPDAFGRLYDRDAVVSRQPFDEAVVVFRDLAEVGPADRRHLPTLVEEADDHGRLLHG
jgi:hypothetical protein